MRSVGLDIGRKIFFCEVKDGQVVERATVGSMADLESRLGSESSPASVAFEACREAWAFHDQLKAWGQNPLMVDTTRVKQIGIGQHKRKTDKIDAEVLARAVERGGIPLAHVLSPNSRKLRMQLAVRRGLVQTRTKYINSVRGIARAHGLRISGCHSETFVVRVKEAELPDEVMSLAKPLLTALTGLQKQIDRVNRSLVRTAKWEPLVQKLATVPGVGMLVAAEFMSVIDTAERFRTAHQVQAYLGLVPSEKSSGKRRLGSITKQGNTELRALLLQAAHAALSTKEDEPLKIWAEEVARRRGRRIAVVALARRIAGLLWAMWRDGTVYDANLVGKASAIGIERAAQEKQVVTNALKKSAKKIRAYDRAVA